MVATTETTTPLEPSLNLEALAHQLQPVMYHAGDIAMDYYQRENGVEVKDDGSPVTKADKEIEAYLRHELSDLLPHSFVLGEETAKQKDAAVFDHAYVWAVDPIDGTANYASGLPMFGISVGLLHKTEKGQKPIFGAVYMPATGELFYNDHQKVYAERKQGNTRVNTILGDKPKPLSRNTPVLFSSKFFDNYTFDRTLGTKESRTLGTTVGNIVYTALGRSCGTMVNAHLWDFAGPLAIAEKLGVHMYDYATGERKETFTPDDFQNGNADTNWKLTKPYIVSTDENYAPIKAAIKPKKQK